MVPDGIPERSEISSITERAPLALLRKQAMVRFTPLRLRVCFYSSLFRSLFGPR